MGRYVIAWYVVPSGGDTRAVDGVREHGPVWSYEEARALRDQLERTGPSWFTRLFMWLFSGTSPRRVTWSIERRLEPFDDLN